MVLVLGLFVFFSLSSKGEKVVAKVGLYIGPKVIRWPTLHAIYLVTIFTTSNCTDSTLISPFTCFFCCLISCLLMQPFFFFIKTLEHRLSLHPLIFLLFLHYCAGLGNNNNTTCLKSLIIISLLSLIYSFCKPYPIKVLYCLL
jgi:hypothetical protein